jgi:cell division GTPase FtsZ
VSAKEDVQELSFSQRFHMLGTGRVGREVVEKLKEDYSKHLPIKQFECFDHEVPDPNKPYVDKFGHPPIEPQIDEEEKEEQKSWAARLKEKIFGKKEETTTEPQEETVEKESDEQDPEYKDKMEAYEIQEKYRTCLEGAVKEYGNEDVLLLFTSIEDKQGFQNAQDLSRTAKDNGAFTIAVVFMPLKVSEAKDIDPWDKMMQELRLKADVVFVLPNFLLIQLKGVYGFINELLELVAQSGVVNLDLADVKVVTKGGNVGVVGIGVSRPSDEDMRVKEAFRRALKHPLFRIDILSANKLLVNVFGDDDMSLKEAEAVAEEVQALVRQKTRIIWGATVGEQYKKQIKIFLMVGVKPREVLVHLYANSGR